MPEGADLLQAGEHRLDRHRRGAGVDHLAEDVGHLELAPGHLGDAQGEEGEDQRRQAEDEERPAPAIGPAGERGDAADQHRADGADEQTTAEVGGAEPTTDPDGVRVGHQRRVHGGVGGLGHPHAQPGEEEGEGVDGQAGQEDEGGEDDSGGGDDRRALVAVGQPAHREGTEDDERAGRSADEDDHAVADPEAVTDVGRQHPQRRALEVLDPVEQEQHGEGEGATDGQPLSERHLLAADAGEQVVSEEDLLVLVGGLPFGLRREDGVGQRRGLGRVVGCAHVIPLELRLADIMPPGDGPVGRDARNLVLIKSELSSRSLRTAPPPVKATRMLAFSSRRVEPPRLD